MQRKYVFLIIGFFVLTVLTAGCSAVKVKRIDVEETIDLSGRWNDTDSRLVAEEMIDDCLYSRPWIKDFKNLRHKIPVVIVGPVANRSHGHINTAVFTNELERRLLNSGKVKFVASKEERGWIREERNAQNEEGNTAPETIKAKGKELGADFMLIGSVNSLKDEAQSRYLILYQVTLELVDLQNNEKVWIGQKHIKKTVSRSKFSF